MTGIVLLLLLQVITGAAPADKVRAALQALIEENRQTVSLWTVSVRDASGREVIALDADRLITPASNLKVLSAAVIFQTLGENGTLETSVRLTGQPAGRTWKGNLVVVGRGDPSINRLTYSDPLEPMVRIAKALKARGIDRIDGAVLADNTFFDDEPYPEGWEWKDLSYYYGVQIDALSFNNNAVDLEVRAEGRPGEKPLISWFPLNTGYIEFQNAQRITEPGTPYKEYYLRLAGSRKIVLKSTMPPGWIETESLSVPEPARFFTTVLTGVLQKEGITVSGQPSEFQSPVTDLLTLKSPPVQVLMREVLAKSNNFYTEMLLKASSARTTGAPGSTPAGIALMKQWLHGAGLDSARVKILDGSGLWAGALWTTSGISGTLHAAAKAPWAAAYKAALGAPGEYGTLQNRYATTALKGRLRAKTGYVSGARTLSGYLTTASGNQVSFSLAANHFTVGVPAIDRIHERMLLLLMEGL